MVHTEQANGPEWMRRQRQSRIWLAWSRLNRQLSVRPNPTTARGDVPSAGLRSRSSLTRLHVSDEAAVKSTGR